MKYKFLAFSIMILAISMPFVNAFNMQDVSNFWDSIKEKLGFKKKIVEEEKVKPTTSTVKKSTVKPAEVKITLANQSYTNSQIKTLINNNDQLKGYIKAFNYDCIYIKTDKSTNFTLLFNKEEGTLKEMKKTKNCEREIYLEEDLIVDLKTNGFDAKKIKSYLEKVDLETSMYFKALKVFTVG